MSEFSEHGYQVFEDALTSEELAQLQADFANHEAEILRNGTSAFGVRAARSIGPLCLSEAGVHIVRDLYDKALDQAGMYSVEKSSKSAAAHWRNEHVTGQILQPGSRVQTHRDSPANIATMTMQLSEGEASLGVWPLDANPQQVTPTALVSWPDRTTMKMNQGDVVLLASRHPKNPDPMIANGLPHDVSYPGYHRQSRHSIIYWQQ